FPSGIGRLRGSRLVSAYPDSKIRHLLEGKKAGERTGSFHTSLRSGLYRASGSGGARSATLPGFGSRELLLAIVWAVHLLEDTRRARDIGRKRRSRVSSAL